MTPDEIRDIWGIVCRHFERHKTFYTVWGFWSYLCLLAVGVPVLGETPLSLLMEWMIVLASIMTVPTIAATNSVVVGIRKRSSAKLKADKTAKRLAELEEENRKLEEALELDVSRHEVVH